MRLLNRGDLQKLTHLVAHTGNVREVPRNESAIAQNFVWRESRDN